MTRNYFSKIEKSLSELFPQISHVNFDYRKMAREFSPKISTMDFEREN